jgi:hypothetical protein
VHSWTSNYVCVCACARSGSNFTIAVLACDASTWKWYGKRSAQKLIAMETKISLESSSHWSILLIGGLQSEVNGYSYH